MMNYIFQDAILKHELQGTTIHVYMDDIGIAMRTDMKGHIAAVCDVLQVACDHDLYFKPKKCTFHVPSMDYLGVILEKGVTHMDPVKITGINNWLTPKKPHTATFRPWLFQFLPTLYQGLCTDHMTTKSTYKENTRMALGTRRTRSI